MHFCDSKTAVAMPTESQSKASTGDVAAAIDQLQHASLHGPVDSFRSRSGKRIREVILQFGFQMAGGAGKAPACLAEAVECLHAGSLVIDDIQDDSQSRRGRPTLHREIGVPLAINAGNWMYFEALARLNGSELSPQRRHRLTTAMIQTGLRCHEGQSLDLSANVCEIDSTQWHEIARRTSRLKTGSLVSLAMTMGAIAASAKLPLRRALGRFGINVGIALQMRNDLDEVQRLAAEVYPKAGPSESLRCDDFMHRRVTWPWVWASMKDAKQAGVLASELQAGETNFATVASKLHRLVGREGDRLIAARVDRHLRLLGEHVVDPDAIARLRCGLSRIMQSDAAKEVPQ